MKYTILNDAQGTIETGRFYDTKQVIEVYRVNPQQFLFIDDSRHISGIVETTIPMSIEQGTRWAMMAYDTGKYTGSFPTQTHELKIRALFTLDKIETI